jgi:hypothetical protein
VLKWAHIPYILACYLQTDADPDPVPDPDFHFDADQDPDADPGYQNNADPCGSGYGSESTTLQVICYDQSLWNWERPYAGE